MLSSTDCARVGTAEAAASASKDIEKRSRRSSSMVVPPLDDELVSGGEGRVVNPWEGASYCNM